MNEYVVNYLKKDIEGYYFDKRNNEYKLKGVCCSFDRTRKDKALKQAKLEPVSFVKVYSYVNEFLGLVREENGCLLYTSPSPRDRTRSRMPSSA